MIKTYSDLQLLNTFEERYNYLKFSSYVGEETFGDYRYLNQIFYKSGPWLRARDLVIIRDNGCDLGIPGLDIIGRILVHHIDPITVDDILSNNHKLYDLDNLICSSETTHSGLHYGQALNEIILLDRAPNDTCPWRK